MPFPLDTDTEAAIAAGRIRSADLVDLYLRDGVGDPLVLRFWDQPGEASYPGTAALDGGTSNQTYQSMYGRMAIEKTIRFAASLSSEPLVITLDGSRSSDDADIVGQFVDADWHQARVRVRQVLVNIATSALHSLPAWEWHGLLDHRNLTSQTGEPQTWQVKCQGGLFRVRGRRMRTRSHEDQQRRDAGDQFYKGTARMVGIPLMWAKSPNNVPGIRSNGGSTNVGPAGNNGQSSEVAN